MSRRRSVPMSPPRDVCLDRRGLIEIHSEGWAVIIGLAAGLSVVAAIATWGAA